MEKQSATIYMRELLTLAAAKNLEHEKGGCDRGGLVNLPEDELPPLSAAVLEIVRANPNGACVHMVIVRQRPSR